MTINVLYITNLGLLDNLGQTQILPYLEGLAGKGIRFYVLSFEKKSNLENRPCLETTEKRLRDLDIKWTRLLYHRRWGNLRDLVTGLIKTFKIVRDNDISILHARATIPVLIAWPVAMMLKRRIIYDRRGTMVGDFVDDVNKKNIFSIRFFSFIVNAIDRFIMKYSDAVIVLSKRAAELLKKDKYFSNSQEKIRHIPCCTDIPRFRDIDTKRDPGLDLKGRLVMTYVGSLGTCYLLKEMAEFFRVLKEMKRDVVFLIVSHTDKAFIEDILRSEGLSRDTDYLIRNANPDEVPLYLADSDLSLMLIKDVDCKIGSSPTKFGESLASGVPVIVNKGIGDTEEIIHRERVGVIVEGLGQDYYRKTINEALTLLNEGADLKNRCIATANKYFSLDRGIEKYAGIYSELI